jgi:TrkA domain protein
LTDLLGGDEVARSLEATKESLPGLTIDWLPVKSTYACEGRTIATLGQSSHSNTVIVAVIRDGETHRTPGPEFEFQTGDTLVAVGTTEGIAEMFATLQEGPVAAS